MTFNIKYYILSKIFYIKVWWIYIYIFFITSRVVKWFYASARLMAAIEQSMPSCPPWPLCLQWPFFVWPNYKIERSISEKRFFLITKLFYLLTDLISTYTPHFKLILLLIYLNCKVCIFFNVFFYYFHFIIHEIWFRM